MATDSLKKIAVDYLTAHFAGNAAAAVALCATSFESVIFAPVQIFPHLGHKTGRAWIEESIRRQMQRYVRRRFEVMSAIGEEAEAALVVRINLTKRSDKRVVDFTSVHLFTFENDLIVRHREFFDSFDLVEQLLGVDLTAQLAPRLKRAVEIRALTAD